MFGAFVSIEVDGEELQNIFADIEKAEQTIKSSYARLAKLGVIKFNDHRQKDGTTGKGETIEVDGCDNKGAYATKEEIKEIVEFYYRLTTEQYKQIHFLIEQQAIPSKKAISEKPKFKFF